MGRALEASPLCSPLHNDLVYQAKRCSLLGSHVVVAIDGILNHLHRLPRVPREDAVQAAARLDNVLGLDRNVARLALPSIAGPLAIGSTSQHQKGEASPQKTYASPAVRLVDHQLGVWQRIPVPRGAA